MEHRWVLLPVEKPEVVAHLQSQLNSLPEALARSLALRGVETFEQARRFFRPSFEDLHDPFLMRDMDAAADRLAGAIRAGEGVLVYGDYDVDGTTATALMVSFLREMGVEAEYFIPDRFEDGYGLGAAGINYAAGLGARLIVALDCGITGHEAAAYARSRGMDLIICDHHTVAETIPEAVAVLDPKRPDCPYPFKELTGCGVGFKLIQATLARMGEPAERALGYLDLVALSIASDIVPILGENRVLMSEGLRRLKAHPRLGLRTLAERARLDLQECTTAQIVFGLGPRLNAAGRMGDAGQAVRLLTETEPAAACELAAQLEETNRQRRTLDQLTLEEALSLREAEGDAPALVLYGPKWHLGVIGIVASRLVDRFYRPAILLCASGEEVRGSARSINDFNIYDALKSCAPLLTKYGGHAYAAGLTLTERNVPAFKEQFAEIVRSRLTPEMLKPTIDIDALLPFEEISGRFWAVLKQFGPFGPLNRNPVFRTSGLRVVGQPALVGQGSHLKFRTTSPERGQVLEVIGFGMRAHYETVLASARRGRPLDLIFSMDENSWNGERTLQLRAKDLRLQEE